MQKLKCLTKTYSIYTESDICDHWNVKTFVQSMKIHVFPANKQNLCFKLCGCTYVELRT
jgi:hypothetical protein